MKNGLPAAHNPEKANAQAQAVSQCAQGSKKIIQPPSIVQVSIKSLVSGKNGCMTNCIN